jgi:tetratricopeptide (TPR) repeat protein
MRWGLNIALAVCAGLVIVASALAQDPSPVTNWEAEVRRQVKEGRLEAARALVEARLADAPEDMEARGWRARVLAWSGRLAEAEADYRTVLARYPRDTDMLVGLADVLARQQRFEEALSALDQARAVDAKRADVHSQRGRVLRGLGRREEARSAFEHALELAPDDAEARAGLDSLRPEPRHELRIGADYDFFNYTAEAQTYSVNLRSKWNDRWTTHAGGAFYDRFGGKAGRFSGSVTMGMGRAGALTVGGAAARDDGVIAKGEAFFEYGRGFRISQSGPVRGVEIFSNQRWLWFRDGRVLTVGPGAILYLPGDWTWSLQVTAARSRFTGTAAEWRPSGITRLGFPLRRDLRGSVFFAVGTENFAQLDQVGRFSARTWGGDVRWQFARRQWVSVYALYQDRSQGRTQASFGMSYGLAF